MSAVIERNSGPPSTSTLDTYGYAAIFLTVGIWAGFALSIRYIGSSALAPADAALIRFGVPAILLLPLLRSRWAAIRNVDPRLALMIVLGAGLPFFFLAAAGGASTSAAHVGALIAGTTPLSVVLISSLIERRIPKGTRWSALALVIGGAATLALAAPVGGSFARGVPLLLAASLCWGIYTIGLRRAGLDAVSATLLLNVPSVVVLLGLILSGVVETHVGAFGLAEAAPFLLAQGLGAGLVASLTYVISIRRLGAERSALIGSLAPALASLVAVPLLGETLSPQVIAGVVAITCGVVLANRRHIRT
ncbi:DMT family transporter [Bosea sp. SSUT16]|jgi:drug/metabolite transporter (DMT)-like permease|uniref:DMT family transporter n=1 Tax=Bosea spartocytisi TaxID=2773451 RepID=A0A927EFH5_9HYPH|nr:DMT family transporter [Bosea spartocytisi]MBD3848596.1 DMT family transporter [Bosea spartocytisi]MCT4475044.1 DMT family transporter [Bosea spartocytisi]